MPTSPPSTALLPPLLLIQFAASQLTVKNILERRALSFRLHASHHRQLLASAVDCGHANFAAEVHQAHHLTFTKLTI
jgi:hypothetical protein